MSIGNIVRQYQSFRKLVTPTASEALLWLMSEVGEMAEAFLLSGPELTPEFSAIVSNIIALGSHADKVVSGRRKDWVRNGDRKKSPNLEFEIGDVRFMLQVFASQVGMDPDLAMLAKFRSKDFDVSMDSNRDDAMLTVATIAAIIAGDDAALTNTEVIRKVRELVGW